MDEQGIIRLYKDRIRIFLIIYFFSEDYSEPENPKYKKVFRSEVKIQKIDFLLRNPDYLAYELLNIAKEDNTVKTEIKKIIKEIFSSKEPELKRLEMEKFLFGAYEDIDDVIGFLESIRLIKFSSNKNTILKTIEKQYFITELAVEKVKNNLHTLSTLKWYVERCNLIKRFFGDMSGSQLKISQYKIDEYRNTSYNDYIKSIQNKVKEEFTILYGDEI